MLRNNKQDEFELELTISDEDSEMILKLKRIIESSSHKLPN